MELCRNHNENAAMCKNYMVLSSKIERIGSDFRVKSLLLRILPVNAAIPDAILGDDFNLEGRPSLTSVSVSPLG